jgi:hypothetical protein
MKIQILNRKDAVNLANNTNINSTSHRFVSIYTPGDPIPDIPEDFIAWQGCFHDCDESSKSYYGEILSDSDWEMLKPKPFTEELAKSVLNSRLMDTGFASKPSSILYVHCDAGISRSRGFAAGIANIFIAMGICVDDTDIYTSGNPNIDVKVKLWNTYLEMG